MRITTRRRLLAAMGAIAVAGCIENTGGSGGPATDDGQNTMEGPPTADHTLPIPDSTAALANSIVSGGVPQDGIPSIDNPQFISVDETNEWLDDGDPVFGIEIEGDVRAYPQRVLVWHEIVNDVIGGHSVAVTYCPLTGTAQGFERGATEFGVSGRLLNSNLVMYDRGSESYWPQMLATAIRGPYEGKVLRELPVIWTTWKRWREIHPETVVLSTDTGFARNYNNDPYGSYNPPGGFYTSDSLIFDPYSRPDDSPFHVKEVVIGSRWNDGSLAVHKESLAEKKFLETAVNDDCYLAVYDAELATGYIYKNPEGVSVKYDNGAVVIDDELYHPSDLPFQRLLGYDAFWFAWAGYYPDTHVVQ